MRCIKNNRGTAADVPMYIYYKVCRLGHYVLSEDYYIHCELCANGDFV